MQNHQEIIKIKVLGGKEQAKKFFSSIQTTFNANPKNIHKHNETYRKIENIITEIKKCKKTYTFK